MVTKPCNVSIPRELRVKAALLGLNISAIATHALKCKIARMERQHVKAGASVGE